MENVQKPKVGAGIKTMSIIQLVFNGFVLIGFIMILLMKDTIKAAGSPAVTTSDLIISLVLIVITTIGIILILMKKELGIYIYFIAEVASIVYSIVTNGFKPSEILSLIIPVLMGIFIWKKKEIFSTENKNIEV
ncbi:hypothetical protein [Clostridium estertheticum]|uniref:hypothetical protein n=1 Tax=Clostridium estertheticum TaxID=238834 RepID=UPI001CF568AC|nr:hypothetical protein [Clostridium estertheticum]MCB2341936.1 hypothetical protein [Clostridium estertheticum]